MEKGKKSESIESIPPTTPSLRDKPTRSTPQTSTKQKSCNDETCEGKPIPEEINCEACCKKINRGDVPYLPPFVDDETDYSNRKGYQHSHQTQPSQAKKDKKPDKIYDKNGYPNANLIVGPLEKISQHQQTDKIFDKNDKNSFTNNDNIFSNKNDNKADQKLSSEQEQKNKRQPDKHLDNSFSNADFITLGDLREDNIDQYNKNEYPPNGNSKVVPSDKTSQKNLEDITDKNPKLNTINNDKNSTSSIVEPSQKKDDTNAVPNAGFKQLRNSIFQPLENLLQKQDDLTNKNTFHKIDISITDANGSGNGFKVNNISDGNNEVTTVGALKEIPKEEIKDPFCNADDPQKLSFHDITSAAFMIKDGIERTPCIRSRMSEDLGMELFMKMEIMQYTGSFKERGARYALLKLPAEQKKQGVIAASLGNHAQGLSYHAHLLGIPATVVMPTAAPIMKIQNCRNYGANVLVQGKDMGEAKKIAMQLSKDKNLLYINGYDHPHIMAGQGTIGLEILEQVPNPDAIIIPIGGAGLIAGIATAIKGLNRNCKIIGVESDKCASYSNAVENHNPIYTACRNTLADGLAVPTVGYNAFATSTSLVDKIVVVKEEWIALGILRLVEAEKCVVEGAGAACLAAILAGHLKELKGKRVVILISGGNIDTTIFGRCLERGLAADGRLIKFTVRVTDAPGGLKGLCDLLSSNGVSVKDIMHERAWLRDVFSVEIKCICETRDWNHSIQVKNLLKNTYEYVEFVNEPLAISHN